jgi:hypothetical protein
MSVLSSTNTAVIIFGKFEHVSVKNDAKLV